MDYMLCRQRVVDFGRWKTVLDSHAEAQRESGLHLRHVWRNVDDPNDVFMLFEVTDIAKASAFVKAPEVERAVEESGAVERAEVFFLR